MKFSDGMEFDLSGPMRIEERSDGLYVVGKNMLIPVNSIEDGLSIIRKEDPNYEIEDDNDDAMHGYAEPTFESYSYRIIAEGNSIKDLVGKDEGDELDLDDARAIGRKISKMKGDDRKKYVGIVNFMGASCRIYNEIWANYKPVDPTTKKSNRGKEFQGDKNIG
jgi:hypothetical protein